MNRAARPGWPKPGGYCPPAVAWSSKTKRPGPMASPNSPRGRDCSWGKRNRAAVSVRPCPPLSASVLSFYRRRHPIRLGVRLVDRFLVVRLHRAALHLERGCQLPRLDGEVVLDQHHLLRHLVLGELPQLAHHLALDLRFDVGERQQRGVRRRGQTPRRRPLLQLLVVGHREDPWA